MLCSVSAENRVGRDHYIVMHSVLLDSSVVLGISPIQFLTEDVAIFHSLWESPNY